GEVGAVEPADTDQLLSRGGPPADGPVVRHLQMLPQAAARIERQQRGAPRGAALAAGVQERVGRRQLLGSEAGGEHVLHAEVTVPVGEPDLPAEAVDAAESKLVAEPGLVVLIINVTPGTVAAHLGHVDVGKDSLRGGPLTAWAHRGVLPRGAGSAR